MKKQKLIAFCLTVVLMFSMSVMAFAADTTVTDASSDTEITIGSTLHIPTIKVTIKTPANVIVNPYQMEYDPTNAAGVTDSLISAPTEISSDSTIKMKIEATPSVTPAAGSSVQVSTTSISDPSKVTDPTVYLTMKIGEAATQADVTSFNITNPDETTVLTTGSTPVTLVLNKTGGTGSDTKYGAFKFSGQSAGSGWKATDLITVKVLFKINPVVGP